MKISKLVDLQSTAFNHSATLPSPIIVFEPILNSLTLNCFT